MARSTFPTQIGPCAIAWEDTVITGFLLPDSDLRPPVSQVNTTPPPWVTAIIIRVQRHLAGEPQDFSDLPYAFDRLPDFHRDVLQALLQVKPGHTATYGDLARALGHPSGASRAIGTALGANPWPLLIPCHRIVAASGKMTGFSGPGGVETKARLLALEGAHLL